VLKEWLDGADPQRVSDRLRAKVWPQGRPEPVAPLAQAGAAAALTNESVVRLRRHLPHTLTPAAGTVVLRLTDRTLTLPQSTEAALKTLLTGTPVRVGELPGLEDGDQVVLVRRLLREAICVPVSEGEL
jgi:hypothetical protein